MIESRKTRREKALQARKAYRSSLKDSGFREEQNRLHQEAYKLGYERGVKAALEYHDHAIKESNIILSPKQIAEMLYERRGE